jgi:hypothetical protein
LLRKVFVDHFGIVERKGNCSVNVGEGIESREALENRLRRSTFAKLADHGFEGHASTRHVVAFVAALDMKSGPSDQNCPVFLIRSDK